MSLEPMTLPSSTSLLWNEEVSFELELTGYIYVLY